MSDLRITLVQTNQFWENKAQNFEHFEKLLNPIIGTDLILLPEMFHTGFSMNTKKLAEKMEDSEAVFWLKNQTKKLNAAIYTSFMAQENDCFFNRGVFVFPNGEIQFYDKRKLFTLSKEHEHFTAGKKQVIVSYKNWKINLQICYDLRFPEISRNNINIHNEADFDICLYVANWPEKRNHHWKSLLVARAIENQCFVVGLNRIGIDGNELIYSGDSKIVSATGMPLNEENEHLEMVETYILSRKKLNQLRNSMPFLKDI